MEASLLTALEPDTLKKMHEILQEARKMCLIVDGKYVVRNPQLYSRLDTIDVLIGYVDQALEWHNKR